jgi:5-methylcytosine-specific restriction protein B
MAELHPRIEADLRQIQDSLAADGTLISRPQLQRYYDTFRREFGPEVLRSLDGQQLLERMHAHGNRDSLVYWLEFKDDDVFPSISAFGSIAGGSALKFGVYRRAETGTWATKGTGSAPKDISLAEAIEIAQRHRDQLLAAVNAVSTLSAGAADAEHLSLQRELARVAPDVQDTAWGHKYLSLIFPDVLDDFHVASYQRYNLIRVLQLPPRDRDEWAEGRYVCAGRFVALAQQLDVPVHILTTLVNRRHGQPRSYWRIGTTDDEKARRKYWPMMRDGNIVAVGWPALGDLSEFQNNKESRDAIAAMVQQHYPNNASAVSNSAGQLLKFVAGMTEGDRVIAADGQTVLGIAEVAGPYGHDPSAPFPHQRPVKWLSHVEWKAVDAEALRTSVAVIRDPRNQVAIERHILDDSESVIKRDIVVQPGTSHAEQQRPGIRGPLPRLTGIPGLVQAVLERKGQVILYGPPGTGKTYWALRAARDLAALRVFGSRYSELQPDQKSRIDKGVAGAPALVRITSFHPEYGYEDFIEGYRPRTVNGSLSFELMPGTFRRLCTDALAAPGLEFYLVIDEINRGDVPRIFGELLTLLERDKRGESFLLPASGELFRVPPNVHVLGTMNTADRSIALLDVALRRRFGFVELMPDYSVLKSASVGGLPLGPWLADLNDRIRAAGGGDARNRQIGHAFLLGPGGPIATVEQLAAVLRDDIVPLLEEYCYDDFTQLTETLGSGLVDVSSQRIRQELFDTGRGADLIAALGNPKLATVSAVNATPGNALPEDETDDDEQGRTSGTAPDGPSVGASGAAP